MYQSNTRNNQVSPMPQSTRFDDAGLTLRAEPLNDAQGPLRLVWLHGWAHSRENTRTIAESLSPLGETWILDLPGHGEAPVPATASAPADFARLVAAWLATQPPTPTVIIGHSLGFRVAIHMAHQKVPSVRALVSLAGAGVPRALSPRQHLRRKLIRWALKFGKLLKPFVGEGPLNQLRQRFGSTDYNNVAPALRPTFLAAVNDNVTSLCPHINLPVLLVYGEADTETPPSVAHAFQKLLPQAHLHMLPHQSHNSLLAGGRHVVAPLIRRFLEGLPT